MPSYELMSRAGAEAFAVATAALAATRARSSCSAARATTPATGSCSRGSRRRPALTAVSLAVAPPERLKGDAKRALDECVARAVSRSSGSTGSSDSRMRPVDRRRRAARHRRRPRRSTATSRRPSMPRQRAGVPDPRARPAERPARRHRLAARLRVRATATVTFVGLEAGLYSSAGVRLPGALELADLDVPPSTRAGLDAGAETADGRRARHALPPRAAVGAQGHRAASCCCRRRPRHVGRDSSRVPRRRCASAPASSTSRRIATALRAVRAAALK